MMTKKEFLTSLTSVVILLLATWVFVFPPSFLQSGNNDAPPSLSITTSKFQGSTSGADICRIPGLLDLSSKVAGYKPPPGAPETEKYDLKAGSHFYHSDTDLTIQQIIDNIVPTDKNKILIAYYPSGIVNAENQFLVHPKIEGQLFVNDPADPATSKIPANEGFLILSCQDTKIWKIKNETMPAQAAPANLATIKEGWILVTRVKAEDLATTVKKYPDKIKSIWTQKDVGFNFKKPKDSTEMNAAGGYNMVWLKVFTAADQPAAEANATATQTVVLKSVESANKINLYKVIKAVTDFGLAEAKSLVDNVTLGGPIVIKTGVTLNEAIAIKNQLEATGAVAELKDEPGGSVSASNEVKVFLTLKTVDQAVKSGDTIVLATLTLNSEAKANIKEITFTQKGTANADFFENVELFASKTINDNGQLDSPALVATTKSTTSRAITFAFESGKLALDNSYLYIQLKTKVPVGGEYIGATYNIGIEALSDIQLFENNLILAPIKNEYALPLYGNTYTIAKPPPPAP